MSQTEIACALAGAAALGTMYLVTKPSRHAATQVGGGTCASAMKTVMGGSSDPAPGAAEDYWHKGDTHFHPPELQKHSATDQMTRRRLAADTAYNYHLHESLGTKTIGSTIIRPGMCGPSKDPAAAANCAKLKDVMVFNVPCDHLDHHSPPVAQN